MFQLLKSLGSGLVVAAVSSVPLVIALVIAHLVVAY